MASRPPIQVNVPPPPARHNNTTMNGSVNSRMLSPDKALQFTPIIASVLPVVDRIPIPQPSRVLENARLATSPERAQARQLFQQPNMQGTIQNQIAALLNRDDISQYDFKLPPSTTTSRSNLGSSDLGLSLMARSILKMAKVDYRYPTPDEDSDTILAHTPKQSKINGRLSTPAESKSPPSRPKIEQQRTFDGTSVTKQTSKPLVVQVPAPPASYRREDYTTIQHSPKRRKVSHDEGGSHQISTQKQQSDEALQAFEDQLNDIFEGQDLIDAADGNITNAKSSAYFETFENEAEDGLSLNIRTLDRLREDMRRLISLRRLQDVSTDKMRRLQQICEPFAEKGQTLYLNPSADTSEDEVNSWRNRLIRANTSLGSALVIIYSMIGNPQTDSLISTDMLRWASNVLVNVVENCVTPIVEARPDAKDGNIFQKAASCTEPVKQILNSARRLLDLMATACIDVKGAETCVNTIEFLAAKLIFLQNATSEKSSVLGVQVYESFRKSAMAALSKLYARFPRERSAILDEILSSLDKLPSTSRSARIFRTGDGQSIQLITALFMQLVQTTAMEMPARKTNTLIKRRPKQAQLPSEIEVSADVDNDFGKEDVSEQNMDSVSRLDRKVEQRFNPASKSAQDIVLYLVARASKTTKTGDSPYRSILDLLVEDLINVLDIPEWPSAELLLNVLAAKMLDLAKTEKTASAKNMALESLGVMGSAISKLRSRLPSIISSTQGDDSDAARELQRLADVYSHQGGILPQDLVATRGPFMMTAKYLETSSGRSTLQQQSAQGYFAAHFASLIAQTLHSRNNQVDFTENVEYVLDLLLLTDGSDDIPIVSRTVAHAAYLLCILHLRFCRRLPDIAKALSSSLSSDQAQVRSRSLKSVAVMLEIDSSLLERDQTVADDVFRCASDDSAMVRDSALSLIARFIIPRGGVLERRGIERLLQCAGDEKIGVQKRSIGHLKEIYSQESRIKVKIMVAQTLFRRLDDPEEAIVTLAEQILEDVLIKPVSLQVQSNDQSATATVAAQDLASTLMAFVADAPQIYVPLLKKFLTSLLRTSKKSLSSNNHLCTKLVQALFEKIIATEKTKEPLLVLTALAEADPKLVPPMQLSKLQVYLSDFQKENDLFMFISTVDIFRLVLPYLSESHKTLLKDIQDRLMQSISKLSRRLELDAVMQCLATIDGVIRNTERLVKLASSVLNQLPSTTVQQPVLSKLLKIAGALGKHVDIDRSLALFQRNMANFKGTSVSGFMVNTILPLTDGNRPIEIRLNALESLGSVCQANPAQFNKSRVRTTFFDTLKLPTDDLESIEHKLKAVVLNIFDELFSARATSKEKAGKGDETEEQGLKQMGGDARSRDQDSAVSAITMDVVDAALKISLSEVSDNAVLAAKTLASISHQGLIHPKQCLGAFVAFGTSDLRSIATIGHRAQHLLHEQHESHCEREYMSAITEAFKYQGAVAKDSSGAMSIGQAGFKAKLGQCFEIVTVSNSKYVKKFLSGLVSRTTIDTSSSEKTMPLREHVMFTRFVMQNVAFFDYKKVDELLHVILQLELAYSKSGGEVASLVETAQQQYPDLVVHQQIPGNPEFGIEPTVAETKSTDPALFLELKRLSTAAATLALLIETRSHLLRQYGVGRDVRQAMTNNKQAKETTKAPTKVHGITGEKFWNKSNTIVAALEDDRAAEQLCKDFVAAMSIDDDVDMGDETTMNGDTSICNDDNSAFQHTGTPSGRKRKLSATPGTTPTKRPRGRPRKSHQRRSSSISTNEDPNADFEV